MSNEKQLLRIIEGALKQLSKEQDSKTKRSSSDFCKHYSRVLFPYAIIRGNDKYYMLNREYKPLGVGGYSDYVEYDDYPCSISEKTYQDLKKSKAYKNAEEGAIFIYGDGNTPWQSQKFMNSYMDKLEAISKVLQDNTN